MSAFSLKHACKSVKDGDPPEGQEKAELSTLRDGHRDTGRELLDHIMLILCELF